FSLIVTAADSFNQTVTITGPSAGGTLTDSGTDSFSLDDQVTFNVNGTASDSFQSKTSSSDQYSMNLSGLDAAGGNFNVNEKGNNSSSYSDNGSDAADGSG